MLVPRRVYKPTGGSFKYIRLSTLSVLLYPKLHPPTWKCFPRPTVNQGAGARSRKAVGIGKSMVRLTQPMVHLETFLGIM